MKNYLLIALAFATLVLSVLFWQEKSKAASYRADLDLAANLMMVENNLKIENWKYELKKVQLAYYRELYSNDVDEVVVILDRIQSINNNPTFDQKSIDAVYKHVSTIYSDAAPFSQMSISSGSKFFDKSILVRNLLNEIFHPVVRLLGDEDVSYPHQSMVLVGRPYQNLKIPEGDTLKLLIHLVHNDLLGEPVFELIEGNNIVPTSAMSGVFSTVAPGFEAEKNNICEYCVQPLIRNKLTNKTMPYGWVHFDRFEVIRK